MHNAPLENDTIDHVSRKTIYGVPEGYDAIVLAEKAREAMRGDKVLMHIALDDVRIAALEEYLSFFAPDVSVLSFPAWDCLPYDRVSPHADIMAKRVSVLVDLIMWAQQKERKPRILITSINATIQRVMPRESLRGASFFAQKNGSIDLDTLQQFLTQNGYVRTQTVRDYGEFAVRGGIVDLYPSGYENPVRIDLFGDQVESVRFFDPSTQRTEKEIDALTLHPVSECFLNNESVASFRSAYRRIFGIPQAGDPLYEAISSGRKYNGMEHWLPLFHEKMETIFDYVPDCEITYDFHVVDAYTKRIDQINDFYTARKDLEESTLRAKNKSKNNNILSGIYHPLPVDMLYITLEQWGKQISKAYGLSGFGKAEGVDGKDHMARKGRDFIDTRALPDGDVFAVLRDELEMRQAQGQKCGISACTEGSLARIRTLMEAAGITNIVSCNTYNDLLNLKSMQTGLMTLGLEHGFDAPKVAIYSEQDILGDRLGRKAKKRKVSDNFLTEVSSLAEGDLVVHIDHGVGRFLELEMISASGVLYDCLKIEYAGGDRLYVPVINMDVLSRFGSDEGTVQLDKLGGAGWQARKAKAKKNLLEMADKLLGIAAARQLKKAQKLHIDSALYNEFSARFPYEETEDQQRAIDNVLHDLAGSYPMDHLVCGDVGFGKTEVALRASYVAAMSGAQVAIIVPTTLLARQHYNNFQKRFSGTGIRVEQLSRLVTPKDIKRTKEGLKDGSVQIVIGTHALFSNALSFNNLGLLIVDEEQRFGVKQKEKLKELKNDVHVLTLTATPIPRTLQMSLTGVKEMSLITTPPIDRLAIRTFVMPLDTVVIRDALLREFYRGGQSFYVVPRIKDLKDIAEMLRDLVPEIRFIEAHGQMPSHDLEDRMSAFCDGQYHVLLATNIIESGIDIASANTLIVHRADMFGLAQLYQIRGRIGRSKQRAYAYLTYAPNMTLNPQAQKRLEVMETLDTLGAGFQLASHDMDIRGAGNLLGDQQSGHIREIGVELYQQMLEEAVAAVRAGAGEDDVLQEESWSPQINLGTSFLIPESYVADLSVRMSLYRRLSDIASSEDIDRFAAELIDRFGELPQEVENLLEIMGIKDLCKKAGISRIDAGTKGAILEFNNNTPPNVEGLMRWMQERKAIVKLRPDQRISVTRSWDKPAQRIKGVKGILKELLAL